MGALSSKVYQEYPDRSIGTVQDAWTRQTCPVPFQITGTECIQTGVNNPWAMTEACDTLPTCVGFDWDPLGATVTFHNQVNLDHLEVTPGKVALVQKTVTNWPLIIGVTAGLLVVILFIVALFMASRLHEAEQTLQAELIETRGVLAKTELQPFIPSE